MANRYSSQLYPVCSPTKTIKRNFNKPKRTENIQDICYLLTINGLENQYYKLPGGGGSAPKMKQRLKQPRTNRAFTREIEKYLKMNDNEDTIYQNVWNAPEAVPEENSAGVL